MVERADAVTFKGSPVTLVGPEIKVGDKAPSFKLVGNDLADVDSASFEGEVLVLSVVLSLDTPVCNTQIRVFNEKAAGLSGNVRILAVSLDLPFAQARFCGAEGIERVITASDYKYRTFGEAYGVFIREFGLLARAVFVIDSDGRVVHVQYVPEATDEPDYDAVLDAVKACA